MKHRVMIVVNNGKNWAECSQGCSFVKGFDLEALFILKRNHERIANG